MWRGQPLPARPGMNVGARGSIPTVKAVVMTAVLGRELLANGLDLGLKAQLHVRVRLSPTL